MSSNLSIPKWFDEDLDESGVPVVVTEIPWPLRIPNRWVGPVVMRLQYRQPSRFGGTEIVSVQRLYTKTLMGVGL